MDQAKHIKLKVQKLRLTNHTIDYLDHELLVFCESRRNTKHQGHVFHWLDANKGPECRRSRAQNHSFANRKTTSKVYAKAQEYKV